MRRINIESKAVELAKAIKKTEQFANLSAVHARIMLDPIAQQLISEMEQCQLSIEQAHTMGQPVHEQIQRLQNLQHRAMQNETMKKMLEVQEAFSRLMEETNSIITRELFS